MSSLTVSGTMTFPVFSGGPNVSVVVGSPSVGPSSASSPTLTYDEGGLKTLQIDAGATHTMSFDTVASAGFLYVGCSRAVSFVLNGGTDSFDLEDGGFLILFKSDLTALEITAGVNPTEVSVVLLGQS
jgi:hypothetical protein